MSFKTIRYEGEGIRLDRFLKREIPNLTQGVIEKGLRKGLIKVNDKIVKTGFRLKDQEEVKISQSLYVELTSLLHKNFSTKAINLAGKILNDYLIYDSSEFIAINKPPKLATQGGSKISLSIDDALCYLNSLGNEYKLVHRIDKDTSGILLIARGYNSAAKLTKAFHDGKIQKTYLAIVEGELPEKNGEIQGIISKNHYRIKQVILQDIIASSKFAITKYKLIKKLSNQLSLVEFTPVTGRMHQLRIHAKEMGCPIMGDKKYGFHDSVNFSSNMLLHAFQVILLEEIFGQEITIKAELPLYFKKVINKF